ncbi:MAG: transcription elongation factor GreA, partial [Mucilaginibacter sp.]
GLHEAKIAKMGEMLANARLLDDSKLDTSKVLALSIVKIKNIKNPRKIKKEMKFQNNKSFR